MSIRIGIFHKIFLTVLSTLVLVLGLSWWLESRISLKYAQQIVEERHRNQIELLISHVDNWIGDVRKLLEYTASLPQIRSMDPAQQTPILKELARQHKAGYLAFIVDPWGENISRSDGESAKNYRDRVYVRELQDQQKPFSQQLLIGRSTGKPALVISVPVASLAEDNPGVGVLALAMDLEEVTAKIVNLNVGYRGQAHLLDEDARLIIEPDFDPLDFLSDRSTHPGLKPNSKDMVLMEVGFESTDGEDSARKTINSSARTQNGWYVIVSDDHAEAYALVSQINRQHLFLLAGIMLVAALSSLLLTRGLVRPVHRIREALQQVGTGKVVRNFPETDRTDELGDLARATDLSLDNQILLNRLFQISLVERPLDEVLDYGMMLILSAKWLGKKPKGALYLHPAVNLEPSIKVEMGLAPGELAGCATLSSCKSHCGRQIAEGEPVFSSAFDMQQWTECPLADVAPFCILPLPGKTSILGGMLVFLPDNHRYDGQESQFLLSAAGFLSAMIEKESTERALKESEKRIESILDNTAAVVYLKHVDGRYLLANKAFEKLFAIDRREVLGQRDCNIFPPEIAQNFGVNDKLVASAGEAMEFEEVAPHTDGLHTYVSVKFPLRDSFGEIYAVGGISTDITQRKRMEQELLVAREGLEQRVSERTRELETANDALITEKAEQQRLIEQLEDAQQQLVQSEKLASIGQLAAGVAHEINNPICFVSHNLKSLGEYSRALLELVDAYESREPLLSAHPDVLQALSDLKESLDLEYIREDLDHLLSQSKDGTDRVTRIVQDLRDFSRVGSNQWEWCDLHKGLDSTLNVVWNEIKYKAEVEKNYQSLPQVWGVGSQLNQVFMNLLVNAAHAIEKQGIITLSTGVEGDFVWVTVADTGRGMDQATRSKVFDPFFTTKPVGKGTGLGLSLSYGIVQKHGGRIDLESKPGKGTIFKIWLPIKGPEESESDRASETDLAC